MTLDILDMIAAAPRVFMSITIPDVIDIILLTLLLIAVIRFMSETRATQLLKGIGLIALLYLLVWLGQLKVMTYLFQNFFLQWGLVAIVVVFQPEIRRLLEKEQPQRSGYRSLRTSRRLTRRRSLSATRL